MNDIAKEFPEAYGRGAMAGGGWMFASALQQTNLDFSEASLDRIDRFLTSVREHQVAGRNRLE